MPRVRIPEGDDWKDHAVPCPNCGAPVLRENEHLVNSTLTDPGGWRCDTREEAGANAED